MKTVTKSKPQPATWTFYHGTRDSALAEVFEGCCLTSQPLDALAYCRGAGVVLEVVVDLISLRVDEVEAAVDMPWPCDAPEDRAAAVAAGVDAIEYRDLGADAHGAEIECFRLLSPRAVAACRVLRTLTPTQVAEEFGL